MPARAASVEVERAAFLKAYASAQLGSADWRAQAATLTDYPLYPYLEATYIEHNLHTASFDEVAAYLKRYPGLIPAADLRRNYLHLLARRKDWNRFLALYRPDSNDTLACYALQARLARGRKLDFARDLAALWREPSLPDSCNAVQVWAHAHGLLTTTRLWQRIESAADARRSDTIASLARWLPHKDAIVARRLVSALRHPTSAVRAAARWPDSARDREAAMLAITQLARRSSASAVLAWPRLQQHFHFSTAMQNRILRSLALHRAYDFGDDALALLAALPDDAEDEATRAWRVRVAVARRNWRAARAGLDVLDTEQKQENSWRYMRARVLQKLGEDKKARAEFSALADSADYWGFLSADRLGAAYAICPRDPPQDAARGQALAARPGFARAFELFAVGMLHDARREWLRALRDTDPESQQL
ncbi:MAG: transglycosylase SLT domain-containing protein, partial [Gammaproteobacteria bacterium]